MMHREQAKGWVAWHRLYEERLRKLRAMKQALLYMIKRGMAKGFVTWFAMWSDRVRKLQAMRRALVYMVKRNLGKGLPRLAFDVEREASSTQ